MDNEVFAEKLQPAKDVDQNGRSLKQFLTTFKYGMARYSSGDISTKETRKWLRQDELFSRLSASSGILLLGGLTNDLVQYIIGQPLLTTQSFTYITLVLHVITFIMSVLGFVYTTSRYKRRTDRISCLLIVFNGLIFVLRVVLEMLLINYRREYYNS